MEKRSVKPVVDNTILRNLPSIDSCLRSVDGKTLVETYGSGLTTYALRDAIDTSRAKIRNGSSTKVPDTAELSRSAANFLGRLTTPEGRKVINATGIILHTGLGRAPLSESAIAALSVANGYTDLEVSLETGERSQREEKAQKLVCELVGCEAATVVNNNAAATFLILNSLAAGREAIISRGQMIEIGGSFRMPDVMAQSGCELKEIGTTNRTHLKDYEAAISEKTGVLLHVHTSNYQIRGFTSTPNIEEINALGKKYNLPVIDDLGSGALVDLTPFGLSNSAAVRPSIKSGSTVVCFSGDKLLGGPQAGIICGSKEIIAKLRKNPFFRMFRIDKLTLAALEVTLLAHLNTDGAKGVSTLPIYQMLGATLEELNAKAARVVKGFTSSASLKLTIEDEHSYLGGGSLPDEAIKTKVVKATAPSAKELSAIADRLRIGVPSVFARLHDGALLFDMRTVADKEIDTLIDALNRAVLN